MKFDENLQKLSKSELLNINGGDEPAYGIGYYIGAAINAVDQALGDFFFGNNGWWSIN